MLLKVVSAPSLLLASSHASPITNPSLPVSREQASEMLAKMEAKRVKLKRPLVIVGGFLDIGIGPTTCARQLSKYVDGPIVWVTVFDLTNLPACRERLINIIDRRLGVAAKDRTIEVDVIGQSLGGLVSVYALLDDPALGKRLNAHRVFTLASPLQGAKRAMATKFNLWKFQADMREGSEVYHRLATATFPCPVYSYTRLDDHTVGEAYASLPGRGVWWVDNPPMEWAHVRVFTDPRVVLDIVRRLRDETPVATDPPAPLPTTRPATQSTK